MSISGHGHHGLHTGGAAAGAACAGGVGAHHGLGGFGGHGGGITRHFGEGLGLPAEPMQLIFGTPASGAIRSAAWWQAVPLPGGITMSLVALVAIVCLAVVLASALAKTVVIRCSR
jgi:hypothetical protein